MSVLNCIAPVKEVRLKQRTEPWMSSEILNYIKLRDSYLYKFRKHGSHEDHSLFCTVNQPVPAFNQFRSISINLL